MCGRFTIIDDIDKICQRFNCSSLETGFKPRFNVAPTQEVPVIITSSQGHTELRIMRWGLVPNWAKDRKIGSRLINARIETISEKPSFRSSFRYRRCIIPSNGYYEWKKSGKEKLPYHIVMAQEELFGFAGLWDRWLDEAGQELLSFTIITAEAAPAVSTIHDRMPFILKKEDEQSWLDGSDGSNLMNILKPADNLMSYRVATIVNSPANDVPACIEKIS
ncbi:hypothetical protein ASZ90_020141 [hydrocarbon metagenome]|uniref:Abasic site processing protein n=1 Tax=hydrocarbon metagenome TaxID=938273 RepID=A0A0W8E250_9ZZZZ